MMSASVALTVLACLSLWVVVHAFSTYPLSLLLFKKTREKARTKRRAGRVYTDNPVCRQFDFALCVCAYNEQQVIEAKVQNLLALREREPRVEILI